MIAIASARAVIFKYVATCPHILEQVDDIQHIRLRLDRTGIVDPHYTPVGAWNSRCEETGFPSVELAVGDVIQSVNWRGGLDIHILAA